MTTQASPISATSPVFKAPGTILPLCPTSSHVIDKTNEVVFIRPTEAARAIRKKLKYGNTHRQARALTLLDAMLQNGDKRVKCIFSFLSGQGG